MYLTENIDLLSKRFPDLYIRVKDIGKIGDIKEIRPETARNGMPIIVYEGDSGPVYLHSKYDPAAEAERFIGQFKDVDRYKHVFFYGLGMGYHVEEFCRRWPDKKYTIYEPEQHILKNFLKERGLKNLLAVNCMGIYTGSGKHDIESIIRQYVNQINGEVLFITLPCYERIFGRNYKSFLEIFRANVMNKRASLQAENDFQKLWTMNSIKNFNRVINSPNMLQDKRQYFEGKPAIIAAAGPSLEDELENLRLIKEKGLAYIFAVGSAIKTLIANGILPHGVCIYDPGANTDNVIRIVKEQGLDIPLIYGSSVFSEAIRNYPCSKLHLISSQDTIAQYFLRAEGGKEPEIIIDAPSIAIVALQMLVKLGCAPIILAGQNFAFKNNKYYAGGIDYKNRPGKLLNVDLDNAVVTEDVHGDKVQTSKLFNHMRNQMEMYIEYCGCKDIINSTKGGARINGTRYKPLEELLKKELKVSTVDERWIEDSDFHYDIDYMISQGKLISEERASAEVWLSDLIDIVSMLKSEHNIILLKRYLVRFEAAYNKLVANKFFNYILYPMNRVKFELISKNIPDMSAIRDIAEKAGFIAETFDDVFEACKKDMNDTKYDFYDMIEEIMENDIKVMTFIIKVS